MRFLDSDEIVSLCKLKNEADLLVVPGDVKSEQPRAVESCSPNLSTERYSATIAKTKRGSRGKRERVIP